MLGSHQAKTDNDAACMKRAQEYLGALPLHAPYRLIHYRTNRGADIGVIVNDGERITIWNSFTEKLESMSRKEFNCRVRS